MMHLEPATNLGFMTRCQFSKNQQNPGFITICQFSKNQAFMQAMKQIGSQHTCSSQAVQLKE